MISLQSGPDTLTPLFLIMARLADVSSDPEISADIKKFGAIVSKDTEFPDQGTMDEYMTYLSNQGAPDGVKRVLRESFVSFEFFCPTLMSALSSAPVI